MDSALLHGWKALACFGYHARLTRCFETDANRVLRYHSVGGGFYGEISSNRLRRDIEYVNDQYEIVDLPKVTEQVETKRIALTFDDGYRDFYDTVVPVLHEYDVPATVFVITDAVEDRSFNHNNRYDYTYMDREQLQMLVDDPLVTIGNHTRSHPDLSECSPNQIEQEVRGAKDRLESLLGTEIRRFCYPFCQADSRVVEHVRATHEIGVAGRGRREAVTADTDLAVIPRVDGTNPPWEVRWDLSNLATRIGSACDRFIDSNTVDEHRQEIDRPTADADGIVESADSAQ